MLDLKAVFFDFDGLILDTEVACYAGWCLAFEMYGLEYPLEDFQKVVGTDQSPRSLLEEKMGRPLDWSIIDARRFEREQAVGRDMEIKPGVLDLILETRSRGLKCAVVSSSPHHWVMGHLERRDVHHHFETLVCLGDAPRAKPAPDLYLEALRRLDVSASQALAFEDSYNGSLAAKWAGIRCVAVPNAITRGMDFSHADLVADCLSKLTLDILVHRFQEGDRKL